MRESQQREWEDGGTIAFVFVVLTMISPTSMAGPSADPKRPIQLKNRDDETDTGKAVNIKGEEHTEKREGTQIDSAGM